MERIARDGAGGLDAVQARHADVHEHHVGAQALGKLHRLIAVARLAHHLDAVVGRQDHAEAAAHQVLIVGH